MNKLTSIKCELKDLFNKSSYDLLCNSIWEEMQYKIERKMWHNINESSISLLIWEELDEQIHKNR